MAHAGGTGRIVVIGLAVVGGLMMLAALGIALWQQTDGGSEALASVHEDGTCGGPVSSLALSGFFSGQHDEDPGEEVLLKLRAEGDDGSHVLCASIHVTVERIDYGPQVHNYTEVHSQVLVVGPDDFVDPYRSQAHDWYLPIFLDDDVFPVDAHYRVTVALEEPALVEQATVIYDSS